MTECSWSAPAPEGSLVNTYTWTLERLEPRLVLSAMFAGVGVVEVLNVQATASTLHGTAIEGIIDDADVISGTAYLSAALTPQAVTIDPEFTTFNADGSFSTSPSEDDWDREYTTGFRPSDGFQAGWLFGHDIGVTPNLLAHDGAGFELSFYVVRPASASISDFQGQWSLSMHQWKFGVGAIGTSVNGSITVSGTSFEVHGYQPSTLESFPLSGIAELLDGRGKARLIVPGAESAQTWLYLNAAGTAMIGVSLSESLTSGVVFTATREAFNVASESVPGRYRVVLGLDSAMANGILTGANVAEAGVLDLLSGGTGTYTPLNGGQIRAAAWHLTPEHVIVDTVIGSRDVELSFYQTADMKLMPVHDARCAKVSASEIGAVGLAVRIGDAQVVTPAFDVSAAYGQIRDGEAVVYIADHDENWFWTGLLATYAPTLAGSASEVDVQLDLATGNLRATVLAGGSLIVFFFDESTGDFIPGDLGALTGVAGISGGVFSFQDSVNTSGTDLYFGGRDPGGDILLYKLNGLTGLWSAQNLGQALRDRGLSMPLTSGDLTPFVTAWGALNIVGLNGAGDIEAVWWHSTTNGWTTNNLSDITGAPPYQGRLTVFLTDWSAINIAGTTPDGSTVVTWWVPQFGGDWVASNFTDLFGGPLLQPRSVASYVTSWGQMTVLGLNQTDEIVAYWWAPGFDQWLLANISRATLVGRQLHGELTTQFTGRDEINIYGNCVDNEDLERFSWDPTSAWQAENLSMIAQPR